MLYNVCFIKIFVVLPVGNPYNKAHSPKCIKITCTQISVLDWIRSFFAELYYYYSFSVSIIAVREFEKTLLVEKLNPRSFESKL